MSAPSLHALVSVGGAAQQPGALQVWPDSAGWRPELRRYLSARARRCSDLTGVAVREGDGGDAAEVLAAVQHHYDQLGVSWTTMEQRHAELGRNALRTLARQPGPRWASTLGRPLAGRPAFMVGAGPSLDKNRRHLPAAAERGAVLAVNSSCRAALAAGVVPDAVVCLEAMDLAGHFDGLPDTVPVVLDVRAGEANWNARPRSWAIANHDTSMLQLLADLGVPPVPYEGAAACAALALALTWGADPIVLVGMDLAYAPDSGQCYATDSPFGDLRAEQQGDQVRYNRATKRMVSEGVTWLPGYGGAGRVPTSHAYAAQHGWFSMVADNHGARIINATEGGARIEGTREQRLGDILASMPTHERVAFVDPEPIDTSAARARLVASAHRALAEPWRTLPDADGGLLNNWVAGLVARSRWDRVPPEEIRAALERGCRETLEVLS